MLGFPYFYHKSLIHKSLSWNDLDIKTYWENKTGINIDNSKILNKKSIINSNNQSIFEKVPFLTRKCSTGGTTGKGFNFYQDVFYARQKERAYIFNIWKEIGYSPFDLRVVFRGNFSDKIISYNWFENAYFISPSQVKEEDTGQLKSFLKKLPDFYLHCYPSSLFKLVNLLGEDFIRTLPIKGVMAGSEVFPPEQILLFESKFNFNIVHWYGHSEYAVLAKYCKKCAGFHFYPTYGRVDFLPQHNENIHKIIATSFNKIGTQFRFYDTEDLAVIEDDMCSDCAFPRVKNIIGRDQEFFFDKDGRPYPFGPFLFGIHGMFWQWVADIQFIQTELGKLKVNVVLSSNIDFFSVEKILVERFAFVQLEFNYVKNIDKTKRNKARYFINEYS